MTNYFGRQNDLIDEGFGRDLSSFLFREDLSRVIIEDGISVMIELLKALTSVLKPFYLLRDFLISF